MSLLARLRDFETRHAAIVAEAGTLQPVSRLPREVIETRLEEWRRLIRGRVTQGRMVLERVLAGRVVFTPRADGVGDDFAANTRWEKLFTGIAHGITIPGFTSRDWVLCPDGMEDPDYFAKRDVAETNYGKLPEAALHRAKVSSQREPGQVGNAIFGSCGLTRLPASPLEVSYFSRRTISCTARCHLPAMLSTSRLPCAKTDATVASLA